MKCGAGSAAIKLDLEVILRSVRLLIMGCFFGCFRVKADSARPQSHFSTTSAGTSNRDAVVASRNRLAALLLSEDNEETSCMNTRDRGLESPYNDGNNSMLKDEAKFLKSCGTLPETPIEIRKASTRVKDSSPNVRELEKPKFHSWLPSTSIEKLHFEGKSDQKSISPIKLGEELGKQSDSPEHKPQSSLEHMLSRRNSLRRLHENSSVESPNVAANVLVHQSDDDTLSADAPELPTIVSQCKNKSVRFDCESDINEQSSTLLESPSHNSAKPSPYPTPLKLTDDMQTPGTVYPISTENLANKKNLRIRSQYVYPVFNPVSNSSQLMALKEDDCYSSKQVDQLRESIEEGGFLTPDHASPFHTAKPSKEHKIGIVNGEEVKVEESLSSWLKPVSTPTNDKAGNGSSVSSGRSRSDKTPEMDRPIIGLVATHWNENEPTRVSPKWWDGNGIPNSTNKYKEDQKVSWHATPFEERLEKALTNESLVCQRRLTNGPLDLVENEEESDTALSQLQTPPKHPESVVSF